MTDATRDLLEQHFDTAFAALDGIAKLRELILTLAMQGKLVEQDPTDQPASELLKDIDAEKQRLVKAGKIKAPKPLPPIKSEEVPYALPHGWEWVRLGEIGVWKSGSTPSRTNCNYYGGNIPWVKSGEVKQGRITQTEETITELALNECSLSLNPKGSVLVAMYGANIGEVGILEIDATTNQAICACQTFTAFDERYLLNLISSLKPYFISQGAGAAQPNISREKIIATPFPLPPIVEQHRIVARIDQLMARCDALETLRKEREEKRLAVHAAAIQQLLSAPSGSAWDFIQQHFGELYSVKANVAELRKAILQLAVMGRLVPQDPTDQPASELLKEIDAEKQRLVKAGKIKPHKPLPTIKPEEVPYQLPQGWEWVRLGNVALSSESGWSPQCNSEPRTGNQWGVLKVSAVSWGAFNPNENKALPILAQPRPECEVQSGDFLISRANTDELVARSVIVGNTPPRLMLSDKIVRFNLSSHVNKFFINHVNGANTSRAHYTKNASGTSSSMKNVSRETMSLLPIPLAPIAEQCRIVARIDQLMALCDTLEQKINDATDKQTELLNAVMAQV
ncbi:type I restriction enzyme S subunit [Herbaspirillum sp. 1173]|uniref:restriction endonuclease subunit S n=1 Tax=Herbaspirillum sp. 1173 TaxID=2817734 RepID=UPI0028555AFE|nr:restriction endonuclease subunit S [Herbaspirillum sp. 1173]MDR6743241.1 type I restriction enzyme S subunit [Herbaspirillum sp. 1173]